MRERKRITRWPSRNRRTGRLNAAQTIRQASEADLLEHAAAHSPERAAIPKNAWIIDAIPLTAVGKTFKPALRFDAIARVYQAAVSELEPAARVEVLSDDKAGQLAHIHLPNQDQALAEAIAERLAGYAVGHRIHFAA